MECAETMKSELVTLALSFSDQSYAYMYAYVIIAVQISRVVVFTLVQEQ